MRVAAASGGQGVEIDLPNGRALYAAVVGATTAEVAAGMLAAPSAEQRELLAHAYSSSTAVLQL